MLANRTNTDEAFSMTDGSDRETGNGSGGGSEGQAWPTTLLADEFRGKRVLVTGSSRGIGAALAMAFARLGADVAVHANTQVEAGRDLVARLTDRGVRALLVTGDFRNARAVEAAVDRACDGLGGLDVLVNNAGTMLGRVPLAQLDDAFLETAIDLNIKSVVIACRHALPALRDSRGAIVNTSSISARTGGSPGSSLYSSAKAFVTTFTRSLAAELAPDGIRVNAVAPGTIATDFHQRYSSPAKLAATAARIPLQRLGSAEDCAGAYLFLASARLSGYITGQVIEVNGGQLIA
jgi:3-oxoacyl-[acyl-carrier protein] reductase